MLYNHTLLINAIYIHVEIIPYTTRNLDIEFERTWEIV